MKLNLVAFCLGVNEKSCSLTKANVIFSICLPKSCCMGHFWLLFWLVFIFKILLRPPLQYQLTHPPTSSGFHTLFALQINTFQLLPGYLPIGAYSPAKQMPLLKNKYIVL